MVTFNLQIAPEPAMTVEAFTANGRPTLIRKQRTGSDIKLHPQASLDDDESESFSWELARQSMVGMSGGGLNICVEALDRHLGSSRAEHVAIRWLAAHGGMEEISFRLLAERANRFANVLQGLGLKRGDRLFLLAPRVPDLYAGVLGALRAGIVVAPMFSAFGPEPIATRMNLGSGVALLTTQALYRRKVEAVRLKIPSLHHVLLIDADPLDFPQACIDLNAMMKMASDRFDAVATRPDEMALLHFTSGTTGRPKGAIHVHEAVITHYATGKHALDLHEDDVFWCTADPGWVTGMSYGVITPLLHGVTMVVDEAEFDAERWYQTLQDQQVSVWYTAPTAIRMLMKAGAELARNFSFPKLRFIASVGEPLNPEAVWWGQEVFGMPIHDNWWQTETGGIMIANTLDMDIKPGSMGKPLPGVEACIVERLDDGGLRLIEQAGIEGELALKRGWPSMFRGYLNEDERYKKCFSGDQYLTGDLVRRDEDGYFWFIGRSDDVIKSAGHLIGPFEVESALMEHPAVVEVGVIGLPDPVLGERVKAFVSLRTAYVEGDALRHELLALARTKLGPAVAPREIAFVANLPRTRSGKIMRRLLRARELGLPEGDLSTLEGNS
jgi:acetyl-CoA synthetase